jgi:hypothetical protein
MLNGDCFPPVLYFSKGKGLITCDFILFDNNVDNVELDFSHIVNILFSCGFFVDFIKRSRSNLVRFVSLLIIYFTALYLFLTPFLHNFLYVCVLHSSLYSASTLFITVPTISFLNFIIISHFAVMFLNLR